MKAAPPERPQRGISGRSMGGADMIYLDNAATTLQKPPCVAEAVVSAMGTLGNSGRGAHAGSLSAGRTIYHARETLAALFGFDAPERVVFTANATQALNTAIFGLLDTDCHVLSTDLEHNSVLRPLHRLREGGMAVDFLPADRMGNIDYADFERLLRPNTRAIVCTHASNLTGTVLDLARIGAFAHAHGLLLLVDASQTAGSLPIDLRTCPADVLCFTGHKSLMGPQGTGGLLVREGVDIRPLLTGGTGVQSYLDHQPEEYPTHLEAGTLNGHGIAGLSAAAEWLLQTGVERIHAHEDALARRFSDGVRAIPGVTVYGDHAQRVRAPIVALNIGQYDSGAVSDWLSQDYGIATRSGAHCAPRMHRALGTVQQGAVRFSFGWFNTQTEVDAAIRAVREIAEA